METLSVLLQQRQQRWQRRGSGWTGGGQQACRAMTTKGHIQPGHVPEQKTGVVKNAKIHYH